MQVDPSRLGRRLLDLVVYAVGLTVAVSVPLAVLSLLVGGGLNGLKIGLFLVGFLSFGYATVLLWPSRPDPDPADAIRDHSGGARNPRSGDHGGSRTESESGPETRSSIRNGSDSGTGRGGRSGPRTETKFEAVLDGIPPLRWYEVRPADRFHPGTKLYVASFVMLATSFLMEAVFGVRA